MRSFWVAISAASKQSNEKMITGLAANKKVGLSALMPQKLAASVAWYDLCPMSSAEPQLLEETTATAPCIWVTIRWAPQAIKMLDQ
jgi:hypothetical protein